MHPRHAQAMLFAAAICLGVIAYGFADVSTARAGDHLWPWWFGAAALSCAAFAIRPSSRILHTVSGLLVPLAFASKAAAVVIDLASDQALDTGRAIAGVALWLLVGILAATTWVFVLGPVVSYTSQLRRYRS